MKILLLDLETSGSDPKVHGIHQIAYAILIDNEVAIKRNLHISLLLGDEIDDAAVKACGLTGSDDIAAKAEYDAITAFGILIDDIARFVRKKDADDKVFLAAFNARFDYDFLRTWWEDKIGNKFFGWYIWSNPLCAMDLATPHLTHVRHNMPNFKQASVAVALGIEVDENRTHDAEYDLKLCYHILKSCYQRMGLSL